MINTVKNYVNNQVFTVMHFAFVLRKLALRALFAHFSLIKSLLQKHSSKFRKIQLTRKESGKRKGRMDFFN